MSLRTSHAVLVTTRDGNVQHADFGRWHSAGGLPTSNAVTRAEKLAAAVLSTQVRGRQ